MGTEAAIPAKLPVEFTERIIYLMVDSLGMWPQLGAVVSFDGALDEQRLARAAWLLTIAEPVLGCSFDPDSKPPVWRRVEGIDPTGVLRVAPSEDPLADAELFMAEPFSICLGPQLQAALLRGHSGDTLVLKISHVAVDGGAVKEALYLLGSIYRRLAEEPEWTPDPNLDGLREPYAKAGALEKLKAIGESKIDTPPSDWRMPYGEGRGRAGYVSATIEPEVFRSAIAVGKTYGATVNDILLTAYYRALWRLLDMPEGSRTPCQLSCELRKHLPPGTKTGLSNISNMWTVSVSPREAEDFDGTLMRVMSWTAAWKRAGAGRASAIAVPIANKMMRKQGLDGLRKGFQKGAVKLLEEAWRPTLTNIGVIDEAQLDFGDSLRVADAWLLGPISAAGAALTASTFRDRLHLAIGAEMEAFDERLVSAMVAETAAEVEAWVLSRAAQASSEMESQQVKEA